MIHDPFPQHKVTYIVDPLRIGLQADLDDLSDASGSEREDGGLNEGADAEVSIPYSIPPIFGNILSTETWLLGACCSLSVV